MNFYKIIVMLFFFQLSHLSVYGMEEGGLKKFLSSAAGKDMKTAFISATTSALTTAAINKMTSQPQAAAQPLVIKVEQENQEKKEKPKVEPVASVKKFSDLAPGSIPADIEELAYILTNEEACSAKGIHVPSGVLLVGPPGTGKSTLVEALASEIGAHFFRQSASSFIRLYSGSGGHNIEILFRSARELSVETKKRALIFIDELDAIGRRTADVDLNRQEDVRTINELLGQMDLCQRVVPKPIVFGATNNPKAIDDALQRSGRLDQQIEISLPSFEMRKQILSFYIQQLPKGRLTDKENVDELLKTLAEVTEKYNYADMQLIVQEANRRGMREPHLDKNHFLTAYQKLKEKKARENISYLRK